MSTQPKKNTKTEDDKKGVPATTSPRQVAVMPSFMKGDEGKGTEGLTSSDYEMPRLKLLQGLSEELQNFDGLKAGQFFHTLAEEGIGAEVEVVPIYTSKRYVLWRPRHDGGGILARADDAIHWNPSMGEFTIKPQKGVDRSVTWKLANTVAASRLDQWGTYDPSDPNSQPAATLCYVVVVGLPEYPDLSPVALMLQRTAVGPARKLMGKLKISRTPCFGLRFMMSSFIDDRNGQKFNNYRFTANGFVEDEPLYNHFKGLHEQFSRTGVKVRDEDNIGDDNMPGESKAAKAAEEKSF